MSMAYWDKLKKPPLTALKSIQAGRLRGKSDINPQWRYQAMTEIFGPCGIGWKYSIDKLWNEPADNGQVFCFALVSVYVLHDGNWSDAIPGIGGSMLVEQESKGMHSSDEGYKMAVTDALSVALKMLGVAAEVYLGNFDGSKYRDDTVPVEQPRETQKLDDTILKFIHAAKDVKELEAVYKDIPVGLRHGYNTIVKERKAALVVV